MTLEEANDSSSVSLLLNASLDYETTPELSISVVVRNVQPAHPSLCTNGNDGMYMYMYVYVSAVCCFVFEFVYNV